MIPSFILLTFVCYIHSQLYKIINHGENKLPLNAYEYFLNLDISEYEKDQENLITFYLIDSLISNSFSISSKIESCGLTCSSSFPLKSNDFSPIPSEYNGYYHLFFKNTQSKNQDNRLLISLKISNNIPLLSKETIILTVAEKPKLIPIANNTNSNQRYELNDYYPILLKVNIERQNNIIYNYAFSCFQGVMTVFNGDYIEEKEKTSNEKIYNTNPKSYNKKIFVLSLPNNSTSSYIISILLFGPKNTVFLFIEKSESFFYTYLNQYPPIGETIQLEIQNAFKPFHFIAEYTTNTSRLIYIEKVFGGRMMIYYEDSLNVNNLNDALPKENKGKYIKDFYVKGIYNVDLFTIECQTSCGFNMHFIAKEDYIKKNFTIGESYYALVTEIEDFEININANEDFIFEIIDINYNDINVKINELETIEMNENNNTYAIDLKSGEYNIAFTAILDETLIVYRAMSKKREISFIETNGTFPIINNKEIYFKFPHNNSISSFSFDIIVPIVPYIIKYLFGHTQNDIVPNPTSPSYQNTPNYKIELPNPYFNQEYTSIINEKDYFYFVIHLNQTKSIVTINFNVPILYEQISSQKEFKVTNESTYSLSQATNSKLLFILMSRCTIDGEIDLYLKYNNIILFNELLQTITAKYIFDTKMYHIDIEFRKGDKFKEFPEAHFYYEYLSKSEVNDIKINPDFSILFRQFPKDQIELNWNSPFNTKYAIQYNIYQTQLKSKDQKINLCKRESNELLKSLTSSNPKFSEIVTINQYINESYIYIIAEPEEGIKHLFTYNSIRIPGSQENKLNNEKIGLGTILLMLIIVILILIICLLVRRELKRKNLKNNNSNMYHSMILPIEDKP